MPLDQPDQHIDRVRPHQGSILDNATDPIARARARQGHQAHVAGNPPARGRQGPGNRFMIGRDQDVGAPIVQPLAKTPRVPGHSSQTIGGSRRLVGKSAMAAR